MKRYVLLACGAALSACDPSPPAPEPAPETKAVEVQTPAPASKPEPEVPRRPMAEICRQELAPHWGKDPTRLWKSLDVLAAQCKGDAFCEGEEGFVSLVAKARKENLPATACMGCHATWRARWKTLAPKEASGPGVHFSSALH